MTFSRIQRAQDARGMRNQIRVLMIGLTLLATMVSFASEARAQLSPPIDFPENGYPDDLQKLKDVAAQANAALKTAQDTAGSRLEGDPKLVELTAKFTEAKKALDAALANGEDVQAAAQEKMAAGSAVTTYTHDKISADPVVAHAKQVADAANTAVDQWIQAHSYQDANDIVRMNPALNWLSHVTNVDRYFWGEMWFRRIDGQLDKVVNKHPAQLKITIATIDPPADASTLSVIHAVELKTNHLVIRQHVAVVPDSLLAPGMQVEIRGLLQATAEYQAGGFVLDVNLTSPEVLKTNLSIANAADNATPNVGTNVTYTVKISNAAGAAEATNLKVRDSVSPGQTLLSSTPSAGSTYADEVWKIASIPAGGSASLVLVAKATDYTALNNSVTVTSADEPNAAVIPPSIANVQSRQIRLKLDEQVDNSSPILGDSVTITTKVENDSGGSVATNVKVSVPLPDGLDFQSSNLTQGTYDPKTGVWAAGTIPNGKDATLDVMATASSPGSVDVPTAVVIADEPNNNALPTATTSVNVLHKPPPPPPPPKTGMPPWMIPVGIAVVVLVIVILRR